jgi:hypothetical protein
MNLDRGVHAGKGGSGLLQTLGLASFLHFPRVVWHSAEVRLVAVFHV